MIEALKYHEFLKSNNELYKWVNSNHVLFSQKDRWSEEFEQKYPIQSLEFYKRLVNVRIIINEEI